LVLQKREVNRGRIHAARDVFGARGYLSATIEEIAETDWPARLPPVGDDAWADAHTGE
jgi:hypothetical protein